MIMTHGKNFLRRNQKQQKKGRKENHRAWSYSIVNNVTDSKSQSNLNDSVIEDKAEPQCRYYSKSYTNSNTEESRIKLDIANLKHQKEVTNTYAPRVTCDKNFTMPPTFKLSPITIL